MVRILRNDAKPCPTVSLVSDDEKKPSSSSSSSSTESSSDTEEEAQASPSPISDFIEEDDGPQPLPKSSAFSWEPVKRRRKRIRTLRKKPRIDKVDADEEESTSTTSTSSEGIARPNVEADADDEESQVESPAPPLTPSKRRRPRRAAAPRCFLDALTKFVEPMSKSATEYTKRTIREIWHDDEDWENSGEDSDDSSIAYVSSEEEEAPTEALGGAAVDDNQYCGSSTASLALNRRRQVQSTDSYDNGSSHMEHADTVNAWESEDAARLRNTEDLPAPQSPYQPSEGHRSLLDLSDTDEDVPLSTVLDKKPRAVTEGEETTSALPQCTYVEPQNASAISGRQRRTAEIIDLCSDEEYTVPTFEDEPDDSNIENIRDRADSLKHEAQRSGNKLEEQEQENVENRHKQDCDGDERNSFEEDTAIFVKAEASDSAQKGNSLFGSGLDNDSPTSTAADRGVMHKGNAFLAATLAQSQSPQTKSHSRAVNTAIKSESSIRMREVESGNDYDTKPKIKDNESTSGGKEQNFIDAVKDSGQAQCNQRSWFCVDLKGISANLPSEGLRPRHRFQGAKQRGRIPHPDRVNNRVPKSESEIRAWLEFMKAEARDIYRAFTAEAPARKFKCANTDVTFIRQVLAELGKLMGLQVRSVKEGSGRRIVLQRSPFGTVGGSEKDVEEAVEGFFYDALADLTDKGWSQEPTVAKDSKNDPPRECKEEKVRTEEIEEDKTVSVTSSPSISRRPYGSPRPWRDDNRTRSGPKKKQRRRSECDDHNTRRRRYR